MWSPICVGFDTVYLLDFAKPKQKYSYAASFAVDKLPADKEHTYKELLSQFQLFSVREKAEQILLKILSTEKLKSVLIPRCCLLKMIGIK